MAAFGERLRRPSTQQRAGTQLLQRRARWAAEGGLQREAGGAQQPAWGGAELRMALIAARFALAEAQRVCAAAHAAQEAIVGRLPA